MKHTTARAWRNRCPVSEWRRRTGWTQSDVASKLGVSLAAVKTWEQGARRPSSGAMVIIAELLVVETAWLEDEWMTWLADQPAA